MSASRIAAVSATAALVVLVAGCGWLGLTWDVAWQTEYEADDGHAVLVNDMAAAPDGGVIAVGMTSAWGADEYDGLVIRLDDHGRELTRTLLSGPGTEELVNVRSVAAGGFVACGSHSRYGWLVRLDDSGDTLWTRSFGDTLTSAHLGAVTPTSDGGFQAVGHITVMGQGEWPFLVRTDAAGQELWRKNLSTASSYEHATSLYEQPDGGFLISSYPTSLIRTNAAGDTLWTRKYSTGFKLSAIPEGGYYGTGTWIRSTLDSIYIVTAGFDTSGQMTWTSSYREEFVQTAADVATIPDGGCVVFGTLGTIIEGGNESHALVLRFSKDGGVRIDHPLGSDRSACSAGIAGDGNWFTVAIREQPLDGPERLILTRIRP